MTEMGAGRAVPGAKAEGQLWLDSSSSIVMARRHPPRSAFRLPAPALEGEQQTRAQRVALDWHGRSHSTTGVEQGKGIRWGVVAGNGVLDRPLA